MLETLILATAFVFYRVWIYSGLAPHYRFLLVSKCHFLFCFCLLTELSPVEGKCQSEYSRQLNCHRRRHFEPPKHPPGTSRGRWGTKGIRKLFPLEFTASLLYEVTMDIATIGCLTSTVGPNNAGVTSQPSWPVNTISVWKMTALSNEGKKSLPCTSPRFIKWFFYIYNLLLHSEHPHPFISVTFSQNTGQCPQLPARSLENKYKAFFPPSMMIHCIKHINHRAPAHLFMPL